MALRGLWKCSCRSEQPIDAGGLRGARASLSLSLFISSTRINEAEPPHIPRWREQLCRRLFGRFRGFPCSSSSYGSRQDRLQRSLFSSQSLTPMSPSSPLYGKIDSECYLINDTCKHEVAASSPMRKRWLLPSRSTRQQQRSAEASSCAWISAHWAPRNLPQMRTPLSKGTDWSVGGAFTRIDLRRSLQHNQLRCKPW